MSTLDTRPGELNLRAVAGDDLAVTLNFVGFSLTGETLTAQVFNRASGAVVATFAVVNTDADTAVLTLADVSLAPDTYQWALRATVADKTLAAGSFTVSTPSGSTRASSTSTATITVTSATATVTAVLGAAASLVPGTITTGEPGSSVAVTITGTAPTQALNVTIPRGDVGATGAPGVGIPSGGSPGDIVTKSSGAGSEWVTRTSLHTALAPSNDYSFAPNVGEYYGGYVGTYSTALATEGFLIVAPWMNSRAINITGIGVEVTSPGSAGAVIRLGVFTQAANGALTLLFDAGTISAETTGFREIAVTQVIPKGLVYLGACVQGGAATRPTWRTAVGRNPLLPIRVSEVATATAGRINTGVSGAFAATYVAAAAAPSVPVVLVHADSYA